MNLFSHYLIHNLSCTMILPHIYFLHIVHYYFYQIVNQYILLFSSHLHQLLVSYNNTILIFSYLVLYFLKSTFEFCKHLHLEQILLTLALIHHSYEYILHIQNHKQHYNFYYLALGLDLKTIF